MMKLGFRNIKEQGKAINRDIDGYMKREIETYIGT